MTTQANSKNFPVCQAYSDCGQHGRFKMDPPKWELQMEGGRTVPARPQIVCNGCVGFLRASGWLEQADLTTEQAATVAYLVLCAENQGSAYPSRDAPAAVELTMREDVRTDDRQLRGVRKGDSVYSEAVRQVSARWGSWDGVK